MPLRLKLEAHAVQAVRIADGSLLTTFLLERGTVLVLTGRNEAIEKYFETARDLNRRGFVASPIAPPLTKASRGCWTDWSETMSRPKTSDGTQPSSTLILRSQVGTARAW